ncbi:MAG: hypothetical protein IJY61_01840 [Candidatus Gastranaerophilales bacterium]|nr:hypothetical protein [Candidatus Gastranaerophilales bacterium]
MSLSVDSLSGEDDDKKLFLLNGVGVSYDLKSLSVKDVCVDYLFLDKVELERKFVIKDEKNSSNKTFNLQKILPEVNLNNAEIWFDNGKLNSIFITVSNFQIKRQEDKLTSKFEIEIISPLLRNLVNIGSDGGLFIDENSINASNLKILVGVSSLNLNGKLFDIDNKSIDFDVVGEQIPVSDVVASLLYFQKTKKPGKQFIENFYNFDGFMDVDLKINELGAFGVARANNLSAITTLFNVPIYFKNVPFNFDGRNINAESIGKLGSEKVYTCFKLNNIGTTEQEVIGYVHSNLTDKLAEKYLPDLSIIGYADTNVNYYVKNKKIYVNYLLKLPKGSDLLYKKAYLGLRDTNRRLMVKTLKQGDNLTVSGYDYSFQDGSKIKNIILGNGLIKKVNGKMTPQFMTCRTNGDAPVSVTGSFGEYVEGGYFNGDLKYDFNKLLLTGRFIVKDSKYKQFYLEEAKVLADNKLMKIEAFGTFQNSPFNCQFDAENRFVEKISINDMSLFLDEYVIKTNKKKKSSINLSEIDIADKVDDLDISIKNWQIKMNKIKKDRILIEDILFTGSVIDNIFSFTMPHTKFAGGILSATGLYDLKLHSSDVIFQAENINSDIVADTVFNLKGQIKGIANASLCAHTKNKLEDIKAEGTFSVEQGYLPKLGSTSFMLRDKKFQLSDIVNIDIKNMKALSSNINGKFVVDNEMFKDVEIKSQQKYLSLFVEGDYNMSSQYADANLFGKYNSSQISRVKILFVPLSWLVKIVFRPEKSMEKYKTKLNKVPNIEATAKDEKSFRVKVQGDLNNNDVNVELKSII